MRPPGLAGARRRGPGRVRGSIVAGPALVAAVLLPSGPLAAQLPWDTPRLIGPESPTSLSLLWTRYGALPGDGD
ncbi:MAG TPA: hypothetical protein VLL48_01460, partial [Longimicrobiales bacterium]|nr:hypothetical protein [Longimicrobiales bacterium]